MGWDVEKKAEKVRKGEGREGEGKEEEEVDASLFVPNFFFSIGSDAFVNSHWHQLFLQWYDYRDAGDASHAEPSAMEEAENAFTDDLVDEKIKSEAESVLELLDKVSLRVPNAKICFSSWTKLK